MSTPSDILRRLVDLVAAVLGLIGTLPLMLLAALIVRLTMGRGVLFRQERLGLAGHPFVLLKFRTMLHPAPGKEGCESDGERLTKTGSVLRATSVDELPSLWNLLRGDITLVGPRPLPVHYWPRFRNEEYRRFEVKPGITGLAQVNGRNAVDWDERLAFDARYVRQRTLWGDLRILLRTIPTVLGRGGISHGDSVTMYSLPEHRPDVAST